MSDFEGRVFHFVYNYWNYSGATKQSIKLAHGSSNKTIFINSQRKSLFFLNYNSDNNRVVIDVPSLFAFRILALFYILIFKVRKNDVCHFHGFHHMPLLIASLLSRACFFKCTLEGVDDLYSLKLRNPIFLNFILRKVSFINSLNEKILRLNKESNLCSDGKLVVIPNGVEIEEIDNSLVYERNCFICVGAVVPRKNVKEVINYYIHNYIDSELPLYIIGPADNSIAEFNEKYYQECLSLAEKYNGKVFFVGNKSKQQLTEYYRRAKAMLFFSHKEGTPNVVLEAISFNCPVIYKKTDEVVRSILDNKKIDDLQCESKPSLKDLCMIAESGELRKRACDYNIRKIQVKTSQLYSIMLEDRV
jgi:glycosyltransferase involved in cell wall biosynthesis